MAQVYSGAPSLRAAFRPSCLFEMRLSFTRPSLSLLPPILHCRTNPVRSISHFSNSETPTLPKPQTPLFLRPPTHSATLSDLRKWRKWAKTLASSMGSKFLEADNGPDAALLHRELNWLIDDALENPKSTFTQLGNDSSDSPNGDLLLNLRVGLSDLYGLWKHRIEERRPFQYVAGCEHWRDLVLSVEEGILIPRPETELIVDLVDDVARGSEELREGLWADLGTGSGALAIGIARILGAFGRVIATDLSPVAVAVASYNVERYNLQREDEGVKFWRVLAKSRTFPSYHLSMILQIPLTALHFHDKIVIKQGSWFEPLEGVEGELIGLVSNPPYIPSEHISGLQAEVAKHEPRLALDGGPNGMDNLLHLCRGAATMLKPRGFFAFEVTSKMPRSGLGSRGM
ncbi:uncharacterized protein LOC127811469 isoform X2 [Diospyros lotus]|uniref:uncharacterized protein LOC127811469 isoform X2 n=1 Tax=Diospyros lotus TaxID=55363 RepID=UPI0022532F7D|nr:uncharacterized protein LOC127811469 isoform X2 [Diospyros lotus]